MPWYTGWPAQALSGGLRMTPLESTEEAVAGMRGADEYRTAKLQGQTQRDVANIQAAAQRYPIDQAMARFNTVWPWVQQQWGAMRRGAAAPAAGQGPQITTGGVYSPQQQQEAINAGWSQAQGQAATQARDASQRLAGRGFGSSSPLLEALRAQYAGQSLQTGTEAERQTRQSMAGANAQQLLASQKAAADVYAQRQQEAIDRQRLGVQATSALLSALSGMV